MSLPTDFDPVSNACNIRTSGASRRSSTQAVPFIKIQEPISDDKINQVLKTSYDTRKRRVSEPRVRNLFTSLHDALTLRRSEKPDSVDESSSSAGSSPYLRTKAPYHSSPTTVHSLQKPSRRQSISPIRQKTNSIITISQGFSEVEDSTEGEMSQRDLKRKNKQSKHKRHASESSNDSRLSQESESSIRLERNGEQDERRSPKGDSSESKRGGQSEFTSTEYGVTSRQRQIFNFLRLNKDPANPSQKTGKPQFLQGSSGSQNTPLDAPATPPAAGYFSTKRYSLVASEADTVNRSRDHFLGLDKPRFAFPDSASRKLSRAGVEGSGAFVRGDKTLFSDQKSKDKKVIRSIFGRMRSKSISNGNKVDVESPFKTSDEPSISDLPSPPTRVRPTLAHNTSLQEDCSSENPSSTKALSIFKPGLPIFRETRASRSTEPLAVPRQRTHSVIALTRSMPRGDADVVCMGASLSPGRGTSETRGLSPTEIRSQPLDDKVRRKVSCSMPDLNLTELPQVDVQGSAGLPERQVIDFILENAGIEKFDAQQTEPIHCMGINAPDANRAATLAADSDATSETIDDDPPPPVGAALRKRRRSTLSEIQALAVNVFNRKTSSNPGKSLSKLLDPKKDISSRLKHLKLISESYETSRLKQFYNENSSYIYYLFHEGFTAAEILLAAKGSRNAQREDMDLVLFLLEKILCNLPELIYKRWQCHSLGQIMLKLLRSNAFYKDGMKFFIAWYSILMENATEGCDRIFRNLLPLSDRGVDLNVHGSSISGFMELLLHFMVTQVSKVMWSYREASFEFLFKKFYQYYILRIFPGFDAKDIYSQLQDMSPSLSATQDLPGSEGYRVLQEVIVKWVTEFMQSDHSGILAEKISFGIVPEKVHKDKPDLLLSNAHNLSPDQIKYTEAEYEMACAVFYQSRENVNIVLEILHQALLASVHRSSVAKRVISVYKHWFQSQTKPCFMDEPGEPTTAKLSDSKDFSGISLNGFQNTNSSLSSSEAAEVSVGLQRILQIFIAQSVVVFVHDRKMLIQTSQDPAARRRRLLEQVDLCKGTLAVYRYVTTNIHMTRQTWTCLMAGLLRITSNLLDSAMPRQKTQSLAEELAPTLIQTLIVTWIRANLNIGVSKDVWNQLLSVLSSLTDWPEVIKEWAQAMEVLTTILASIVYGVDLSNLSENQAKDYKRRLLKSRFCSKDAEDTSKVLRETGNNVAVAKSSNSDHHGSHSSIPPLQQRRQHLVAGAGTLQPPPLLLLQIPHSASAAVLTQGSAEHHLIRSASETNLLSPDGTEERSHNRSRPFQGGRVVRLKSLESLNTDNEAAGSPLWTVRRSQASADSNITPRQLKKFEANSSTLVKEVGSFDEEDAQSHASTLQRISESFAFDNDNSPSPGFAFQSPSSKSSPKADGSMSGGDAIIRPNVKSPRYIKQTCSSYSQPPESSSITDTDSRKSFLAEASSLSSALEDGLSLTSVESYTSDCYISVNSEITPDSVTDSLAGATAYYLPSLDSSNSGRFLSSSSDSPGLTGSGESPSFYKAVISPLKTSEDLSSAFEAPEVDLREDDSNEDAASMGSLSLKHGTEGWTPEVAELMWRRVLGLLGDVNSIEDVESHAAVFHCLRSVIESLLKVHSGMTLQKLHQKTPPILVITPWVFQALTLPNKYMKGKVLAYQLLGLILLQPYIEIPVKHLLRFYLVLHQGLLHSNNDIVSVLIQHCASRFFLMPLDGATILLLDFIHAATGIVTVSSGQSRAPTFEAMSLLGSLICFPNHFGSMPVLAPDAANIMMTSVSDVYVKDCIINVLLSNSASRETSKLTSCVRLCGLGMYVYEELSLGSLHTKIVDAVEAIIDSVKESSDDAVTLTALDMLVLLTDHAQILLPKFPDLPQIIIEEIVSYVERFKMSVSKFSEASSTMVMTNALLCILVWSLSIPVAQLLSVNSTPHGHNNCLLNRIFRVLQPDFFGSSNARSEDGIGIDHNSNYQTFPANIRKNNELLSARLSKYDEKIANSAPDHETSKISHVRRKKGTSYALETVATTVRMHLLNYLGHYSSGSNSTCTLDSQVLECHDISENDTLTFDILSRPDVQFLVWNEDLLISLNELPLEPVDADGSSSVIVTGNRRVITRDISGKHCYDIASVFAGSFQQTGESYHGFVNTEAGDNQLSTSFRNSSIDISVRESVQDKSTDLVDLILEEISQTSPECRLYDGQLLNCIFPLTQNMPAMIDEMVLECIKEQAWYEDSFRSSTGLYNARCKARTLLPPCPEQNSNWPFQACRQFINQIGYLTSENRNRIDLLKKSEQLIRDIRHLDNLICRETHKIAVIYVAEGQEDKASILSNEFGSQDYEEFVAGLGWKVSLEFHEGYLGGLQRNRTNGETAVYFANSTLEIMFHVATIMPSSSDTDDLQKKVRHLGNDEVHIVWSDHHRMYHRNILNTEFADVIIVIYPLQSGLFHIQIIKKAEVEFFGPLFDGAIVNAVILPGLVRSTALNASRRIRARKQHYKPYYEERASCLRNIIQKHSEMARREDFISEVFLPGLRDSATGLIPLRTRTAVRSAVPSIRRQQVNKGKKQPKNN